MSNHTDLIEKNKKHHHIEAAILSRLVKALEDAGDPIVQVWYEANPSPDDKVKVTDLASIEHEVFNLDFSWLITKKGRFVWFILGNEWDAISDYTASLEDALKPVNEWIESNW